MRIESYLVAELLQRWEQQGAALRPNSVEITAALNRDVREGFPVALEASAELHRALDAFVATSEILEDHVVGHDGLGELGESLDELTVRARAMVVLSQLDRLSVAFSDPTVEMRGRGWFIGKLQGIANLVAVVRDRLAQIHAMWLQYRPSQPRPPGMTDTDRATLYRTMLRVALRALCELWDDPDLVRFLECGLAATDVPEVHLSCREIVTVLGLPTKPRRVRSVVSATEAR
jgi:hypothetical protein